MKKIIFIVVLVFSLVSPYAFSTEPEQPSTDIVGGELSTKTISQGQYTLLVVWCLLLHLLE